jgi:hypothetical protein
MKRCASARGQELYKNKAAIKCNITICMVAFNEITENNVYIHLIGVIKLLIM